MDDTQAQAQQSVADEQTDATPTTTPTGNGTADNVPTPAVTGGDDASPHADIAASEAGRPLQPETLPEPDGGTEGNEPPIATALEGEPSTLADVQVSRAADEVSSSDVAQAAAGEMPSEAPWRPADVATEAQDAAATAPAAEASSAQEAVDTSPSASTPAAQDTTAPVSASAPQPSTEPSPADSPAVSQPRPAASGVSGNGETMEELMSMYGSQSFKALKYGDIIEGRIMRVGKDELLVDIGAKSEGIVPSNELSDLNPEEFAELHEGDEILVSVVTPEDNEGHAVLSLNRARQEKSWRKLQKQFDGGEIIQTDVSGYNKGGLLVNLEGVRGFVPSSQVSGLGGSEQAKQADLQAMVGRPISLKIIEINRNRNRLILSERLAVTAQREVMKERLLSELKPGDIRHGRVVSIADFGAFVDIGGADGLIHLSELSWSRVNHPSEVLKVGQEVDVYVLGVDEHERKIALSLKRTQQEPWSDISSRYQIGQLVEGTITQLATFGAFARIADGVEGLIHVSELSDGRVMHPRDVVHEGERHTLRIIRIDPQRKRIGLSLKRAVEGASMDDIEQPGEGPRGERAPRGERSEMRGGERSSERGGERSGERGERGPRPERSGERSEQRGGGERRERGERGDRRPREGQGQMQTTYGERGESAMELAMREAMAQQAESQSNTTTESEVETPRSAMNTVDVTINTNTPPPPMPSIAEPEPADAEAIDNTPAPTEEQDDALASQVAAQVGTPSDESAAQASSEETAAPGSQAEETSASASGSQTVTGESFAATGTVSDTGPAATLGGVEANEAEEREISSLNSNATRGGSDNTTYPAQGDNASDAATEETGTGSEAASQQGEANLSFGAGDERAAATSESQPVANGEADLVWIHGIGPVYNQRLAEAGVRSNEDMAKASIEQLRSIGFDHESDEELQNWIQQATDKLAGSK